MQAVDEKQSYVDYFGYLHHQQSALRPTETAITL